MATAPKRSASDALKEAHGEPPATPEVEAVVPEAPATPDVEVPAEDATPAPEVEVPAEDGIESIGGGTILVTVRTDVAMFMDGTTHRVFPRGARIKVTEEAAERGLRLGSLNK